MIFDSCFISKISEEEAIDSVLSFKFFYRFTNHGKTLIIQIAGLPTIITGEVEPKLSIKDLKELLVKEINPDVTNIDIYSYNALKKSIHFIYKKIFKFPKIKVKIKYR